MAQMLYAISGAIWGPFLNNLEGHFWRKWKRHGSDTAIQGPKIHSKLRIDTEVKMLSNYPMPRMVKKHSRLLVDVDRFHCLSRQFWAYIDTVLPKKGRRKAHEHTLEAQKPHLRLFNENRVFDSLYATAIVSLQFSRLSILDIFRLILVTTVVWNHWWPKETILSKLHNAHLKPLKEKVRLISHT